MKSKEVKKKAYNTTISINSDLEQEVHQIHHNTYKSMSSNIVLPKNFDFSKLDYGSIRANDNGGKMIQVSYNKCPLIIQTPEMTCPFGLNRWSADKNGGAEKYSLDLSFKGYESKDTLRKFMEVLSDMDKKFIKDGMDNSQAWFKKKYTSYEVVEALFTPVMKYAKDKNTGETTDRFPPTFKINLPFRDAACTSEIYDNKRNRLNIHEVEMKSARITAIVQCTGVWVAGGKFGCSWKALQLRVVPPATIKGYAFNDAEDEFIESDIDSEDDAPAANSKKIVKARSSMPPSSNPNGGGMFDGGMIIDDDDALDA